jgi:hypothetical protein
MVSQISEGLSIEDVKPRLENIYKPDESSENFYKSDYSCWKEYIEITISNIKQ